MKKYLLILIALISVSLFTIGQDHTGSIGSGTYLKFNLGQDADTLNASDTYYLQVNADQHQPITQDLIFTIDSVSGAPHVTFTLQGKKFSDVASWSDIGSAVVWSGSTSDTTILISNATANRYRLLRLLVATNATAQKVEMQSAEFKVWRE